MKKTVFFLSFFLAFTTYFAQINDNCINAIPLCSTPSFTFNANSGSGSIIDFTTTHTLSNPITNPFPPNSGCLKSGELNPQWLLITIGNAGWLEFVFGAANSLHPQSGCYDWAMWPYTPSACQDIFNNLLPPIRCNWNGTCSNGTGIASASNYSVFGGNASDFEPPLAVNACQQFVICISNYSGVNTLVSFQSLGTASLSCNPNCNPNYAICSGSSATIVPVNFAALSNPVFSIQPGGTSNTTGSFVVSPTVTTTYSTYITGTNNQSAVQTITAVSTVTVNAQPIAAPNTTQTTCTSTLSAFNLNLTFSANVGSVTPAYSINWSPTPNGVLSPTQTALAGNINPGAYNATITTGEGCSTVTNFTIDPQPDPAIIILSPTGNNHTITCLSNVTLTALNSSYNYTWTSSNAVFNGPQVVFTNTLVGNWTIIAENPVSNCISSQTFAIFINTVAPIATLGPTLQNITCNVASSVINVTATAIPSVNVSHQILAPTGGTFTSNSYSLSYTPWGVGEFTHYVVNDDNGCSTSRTFTVTSNQGFPTFQVVSPQNFTLGCNTKSVALIQITNAQATNSLQVPIAGPVSYTIIGPPTSTNTPSGPLSGVSNYTVDVPGTWTVITKDNTSFCETRTPITILSNTFSPHISALVPQQILNCNVVKTTLLGQSNTPNVDYLWSFQGTPGNIYSDTISVSINSATPTSSVINTYTLNITDNSSTCQSFSIIPMYQNIYAPKASLTNGGLNALSCKVLTITLTNQSTTNIPPSPFFPNPLPVIGFLWEGPTPQEPLQYSTTYLASTIGTYTLTAKDLNNGCTSKTTTTIGDNKVYPVVNNPTPPSFTLDCGDAFTPINPTISGSITGFTYSWTPPYGAAVSSNTTYIITVDKVGTYRVLVTNTGNGCATIGENTVVNGSLTADFDMQPARGTAPLNVTFYNNSKSSHIDPSEAAKKIVAIWNFGNGTTAKTDPTNLSPKTTYNAPGSYKVTLYASKGSCLDTMEKTVIVDLPSEITVPNVFTPNGDNSNDELFVKATNMESISLTIFDRWGHIIYEVSSTTGNVQWDGKTPSGKDAAEGVYYYILKAKGLDKKEYDQNGTISLFR